MSEPIDEAFEFARVSPEHFQNFETTLGCLNWTCTVRDFVVYLRHRTNTAFTNQEEQAITTIQAILNERDVAWDLACQTVKEFRDPSAIQNHMQVFFAGVNNCQKASKTDTWSATREKQVPEWQKNLQRKKVKKHLEYVLFLADRDEGNSFESERLRSLIDEVAELVSRRSSEVHLPSTNEENRVSLSRSDGGIL